METDVTLTFTPQQLTELFEAVELHSWKSKDKFIKYCREFHSCDYLLYLYLRESVADELREIVKCAYLSMGGELW